MSNKPVLSIKSNVSFSISIAGWIGEYGPSFKINKRYKDKASGEYKDTNWLDPRDLAAIAMLIPEALERIKEHEGAKQERHEAAAEEAPKESTEEEDTIPY